MSWVSGDEVIVTDHGGTNPRRLPVVGARASWELSNVGTFSAFARLDDLQRVGLSRDLSGHWMTWIGKAGRWGGVISGRPIEDGICEVAAEGWATLLRGNVLEAWETPVPGQVGGLAKRGLIGPQSTQFTRLGVGTIDEGGDHLAVVIGGQDVLEDYLGQLVDDGGLEWLVDEDRVFSCGRRLGVDRSASVRLVEGRHFVEAKIAGEFWSAPAAETLEIESQQQHALRLTKLYDVLTNQRTLRREGRKRILSIGGRERWRPGQRPIAITQPQTVKGTTRTRTGGNPWDAQQPGVGLRSLAVPPTAGAPLPTVPVELSLLDVDHCWEFCHPGDVVRLLIGSAGFSGWFRVIVRSIDAEGGVLAVAGEAMSDLREAA